MRCPPAKGTKILGYKNPPPVTTGPGAAGALPPFTPESGLALRETTQLAPLSRAFQHKVEPQLGVLLGLRSWHPSTGPSWLQECWKPLGWVSEDLCRGGYLKHKQLAVISKQDLGK